MSGVTAAVSILVTAGVVLVALATVWRWVRNRASVSGLEPLAIGSIAALAVVARISTMRASTAGSLVMLGLFALSGYALLFYCRTMLLTNKRARNLTTVTLLVSAIPAAVFLVVLGPLPADRPTPPIRWAAQLLLIGVWGLVVGISGRAIWQESNRRAAIQKARLRSLALGFVGIAVIFVLAIFANNHLQTDDLRIAVNLLALLLIPVLWAAFAPPQWLTWMWRSGEEENYRAALQQMVLFSPDRQVLAARATEWAARLVGADSGFIALRERRILGHYHIDETTAAEILDHVDPTQAMTILADGQTAIAAAMKAEDVDGVLVVVSGPFTPLFADEQQQRVQAFAAVVAIALERTGMTERLNAIEHAKSDFLNLASHELRGPLTVLHGYLSMLADGDLGSLPHNAERVIPTLVRQTDQMGLIVDQMLESARIEDNRLELRRERVDFAALVERVVGNMRRALPTKHDILFTNSGREISVNVDVDRIETIVINLLDNAIKYSPDGGEIICSVNVIDNNAVLRVSDRGLGIATADMRKLFTRFGRIVTSENAHISGTGLGLYLCRELARRHGGDVTATSQEGKGSTFTLRLPLARPQAEDGGDIIEIYGQESLKPRHTQQK